jgi:DNA-directed RNA polymerase subunit N
MIIPVRCFTCGKVIGEVYENFLQRVELGEKPDEVLDELGLDRFCCRKMIVAHADLINEVIPYG